MSQRPTLTRFCPSRRDKDAVEHFGYLHEMMSKGAGLGDGDNYIVGPANSVAHASARAVGQNPGRAYNPLFIHGSVGLGKTHLLHAVCHEFLRRFPKDRVCFLSCEEFTNEFVRSLQRNDRKLATWIIP